MPEVTITGWTTRDVRFPTSLDKTGSDAMNAAGDYSSAYCILQTDSEFSGHGMVSSQTHGNVHERNVCAYLQHRSLDTGSPTNMRYTFPDINS